MEMYRGSCQCGKLAFEFQSELGDAIECNCSFCTRRNSLLHGVPLEQFRVLKGEVGLPEGAKSYGSGIFQHHFCPDCGIHCFTVRNGKGRFGPRVNINLRYVDGVKPGKLALKLFDGASMPPDSTTWE
jgi:hypothetical protein